MPGSQIKSNCRNRARSFSRRHLIAALSIAVVTGLSGCSSVSSLRSIASSGTWNDTVETLRNRSYSAKAWYHRKANFGNMQNSRDFQAGFRAGYEAIADGKPGCPPAFPPKQYWGWEYQSADGQSRTAAWFQGYPYGVQAAREDGMNQWSHLLSSSECGQCGTNGCGPTGCGPQGFSQNAQGGAETQVQLGDRTYQMGDGPSYPVGVEQPGTQIPVYTQDGQATPFPVTN